MYYVLVCISMYYGSMYWHVLVFIGIYLRGGVRVVSGTHGPKNNCCVVLILIVHSCTAVCIPLLYWYVHTH